MRCGRGSRSEPRSGRWRGARGRSGCATARGARWGSACRKGWIPSDSPCWRRPPPRWPLATGSPGGTTARCSRRSRMRSLRLPQHPRRRVHLEAGTARRAPRRPRLPARARRRGGTHPRRSDGEPRIPPAPLRTVASGGLRSPLLPAAHERPFAFTGRKPPQAGRDRWTGGLHRRLLHRPEWDGDGLSPRGWRDSNAEAEGPVVRQMQVAFAAHWLETGGWLLPRRSSIGPGRPAMHGPAT